MAKVKSITAVPVEVGGVRQYGAEPYVGIFLSTSPGLVIRDYDLVKKILYKDTEYFASRIMAFDEHSEPVAFHSLFALSSERWKLARSGLTRGFTSAKLKKYVEDMLHVAKMLQSRLSEESRRESIAEDLSWAFTVDTLNKILFGVQGTAMQNPKDDLLNLTKELYRTDLWRTISKFLLFSAPQIYSLLHMKAFPPKMMDKIREATLAMVKTKGMDATNFIGLLRELRERDLCSEEERPFRFDGDQLAAQVFAFVLAGTDTLSAAMTYALYELAKNQDYQEILRNEVQNILPRGIDDINYDKLKSMKYLNMIIMETLRLHPSFPFVDRKCTKDYVLPGTDCKIEKGVIVFIPMWGLHKDPKYWERPEEFYPEHFSDIKAAATKPYLPFSEGPRTCIGMRLVLLEMGVFLTSLVSNWRWRLPQDAPEPQCDPLTYTNIPKQPTKIIFKALKKE
ncbi:Cytochrome P450 6j1 [Eumeta japonica]|uniref:unspecific monooxygenase n=1 Tax=Eumeta variegata TaxID=151549 RepID=A0A4C1V042_EUMVA|nr:Cytochrome P450 6j1 [Eumeta japonica]